MQMTSLLTSLNAMTPRPACLSLSVGDADAIFFKDENIDRAKLYCYHCPLSDLCLETALVNEIGYVTDNHPECVHGVFGGRSPQERVSILTKRVATRGASIGSSEVLERELAVLLSELDRVIRPLG
jgi:hypothetical protein